jgi:hypothetical protein
MNAEQIAEILALSRAPSGDNCQPWKFEWDGVRLNIYHDQVRAAHPLDPEGIASQIALGCLIRAIEIAASHFKYGVSTSLGKLEIGISEPWAKLQFGAAEVDQDHAFVPFLATRATDRRLYRKGALDSKLFEASRRFEARCPGPKFYCLETLPPELFQFIVKSEEIMGTHPKILPAVLEWLRYSVKDARKRGDGLSWRNLGVKFFELPILPLVRQFPSVMKILKFTLPQQQRARATAQIKSAAGVVCVTLPRRQLDDLCQVGRLMMEIWLELTSHGYGVQPLTLASMLIYANEKKLLNSDFDKSIFGPALDVMQKNFSIPEDEVPVWMIRTGISGPLPANATTFRLPISLVASTR